MRPGDVRGYIYLSLIVTEYNIEHQRNTVLMKELDQCWLDNLKRSQVMHS